GCKYVVMEVSSFGLVQYRIGPTHFDMGIFTNLTQDHLDYHKTMENYYLAKRMMFECCDFAVVNSDDDYGKRLCSEISCEKKTYGIGENADCRYEVVKMEASGTAFRYCADGNSQLVEMKIPGMFNVANVTAAITVCLRAGISMENILNAVSAYNGVKGRCEIIPTDRNFTVICDYAHTPDAVENILRSVKEYTVGKLICLFGCGGNRDAKKRPLMAQAAAKYADKLIITSDNPRDEIPEAIIDDILAGLEGNEIAFDVVVDRRKAIHHSLKIADEGDVIVLAGKGHEDYQVLPGNEHIHFDEREIVSEGLKLI
ncbi:MAG: UDP-N-acetylmuramoyl-L-alanyl-D-glutamate--2,6-diaminopimelate ligase, partial [Oscillospiraceae bacterium]|nr:UDP-N-acetylmuramoyl-L-alanyl-D-glutamate--2,6-diaminopimelate ligase [Oscillospiraceae bacterium]